MGRSFTPGPRDRRAQQSPERLVSRFPLGSPASVSALLQPLIINGNVGSTILRWDGGQAAADGWAEVGGAGTLALGAGTPPTYNAGSPLLGSVDDSCDFNGATFAAAAAALADIGTADPSFGLFYRHEAGDPPRIVNKGVFGSSNLGYTIYTGNGGTAIVLLLYKPAGSYSIHASANLPTGAWHWARVFFNRSSTTAATGCRWYIQGAHNGAGTVDPIANSANTVNVLEVGGGNGTSYTGCVAYVDIHIRADWFQENAAGPAEWATVAKTEFLRLAGMRALFARGNAEPSAYGSASPCYLSRVLPDGTTRLFYMGANWPRFETRTTPAFVGLLNEGAHTNSCLQSDAMGTTWTAVQLTSITANGQAASDGNATLDGLVSDADDEEHGITQAVTMTAVPWCISAEVMAGNKSWVKIGDGTIANGFAFFDIANGVWGTVGAGVVDKWLLYTATGTVRAIGVRVLGTAAAHTVGIYPAAADNDSTFAGDATTVNIWVGKVQVSAADFPSSRINTTTAAVTRAATTFILPSASNVRLPSGSVRFKFYAPVFTPATRRTLLSINDASANNRIDIYVHTDGTLCAESAKAGGNSGAIALAGSVCDGAVHTVTCRWRTTSLSLSRDGTVSGSDATADILAAATATQISIGQDGVAATNAGPCLVSDVRFGA
jgi:hypothetical protein